MENYCDRPFTFAETHVGGNVFFCCPAFINDYSIGNFFEQDNFEAIWNSEKAKEFRKTILDNSYKYCDLNFCFFNPVENPQNDKNYNETYTKYPIKVEFSHERHCNIRCRMCRDKRIYSTLEETEKLNQLIEPVFLPMLKNAKFVRLNGAGEVFASRHMRQLVKRISKEYPEISFEIHSNGLCFDKKNCDDLGITDRINDATISLHAATKKTYNKLVQYSNFEKILQNIKWLSNLKKEGKINQLLLVFVITAINYREMPKFQKMANKLNCKTMFTTYRPWDNELAKEYEKIAVFESFHPEYKKFVKILQNQIFDTENCIMQNSLKEIINREKHKKKTKKFVEYVISLFKKQ